MKKKYFKDTDSLYIDLSEKPSSESAEISEGVDIDNASTGVDLRRLAVSSLPAKVGTDAA